MITKKSYLEYIDLKDPYIIKTIQLLKIIYGEDNRYIDECILFEQDKITIQGYNKESALIDCVIPSWYLWDKYISKQLNIKNYSEDNKNNILKYIKEKNEK